MKRDMIIRAWKDPVYRASLPEEQRVELPESPSGRSIIELDPQQLEDILGGHHRRPPGYEWEETEPIGCPTRRWGCPLV